MGLLQRFARPEFRGDASQSPPADERPNTAPAEERTGQEGGSVHENQSSSQEPAAQPAATPSPPAETSASFPSVQQPPAAPQVKHAEVIAFANQKGGVAKTTTTLNLAVAFAEAGHRVLAVDLDPQGNLTMSQGIDPDSVEKSMYDVLVHDISIREVIRKREIDVACASIDLAGAEIAMSTKIGRERSLEKALRPVLED